jgi:three-Cys-motif partner protein
LRNRRAAKNGLILFPDLAFEPDAERQKSNEPGFFSAQRTASAVKTKIVVDYFPAWARIMKSKSRSGKIGYLDFFSGPGLFDDGTESTPVQIMRAIISDEQLRKMTLSIFEDKDPEAAHSLSKALSNLKGFNELGHAPNISHGESARNEIEDYFKSRAVIPTFMFLDPFGYVGL